MTGLCTGRFYIHRFLNIQMNAIDTNAARSLVETGIGGRHDNFSPFMFPARKCLPDI
jgi:hypothetical protein